MAETKEVDVLNDSTLVFKARTFSDPIEFNVPVFGFGLLPASIMALITFGVDSVTLASDFTPDAYLWSLIPFLNVLGIWPMCYLDSIQSKLKDRGHTQKVTYWTALQSWYHLPFGSKKKILKKSYVKVTEQSKHKFHGKLEGMDVPLGEATHEVTDYLIKDIKGLRMERVIEPTPLMLWNDALNTVDEGFGLKKISA